MLLASYFLFHTAMSYEFEPRITRGQRRTRRLNVPVDDNGHPAIHSHETLRADTLEHIGRHETTFATSLTPNPTDGESEVKFCQGMRAP